MTVSRLKWRMGFGWGATALFMVAICAAFLTSGWGRGVPITGAVILFIYMLVSYRKWNSPGWHMVHSRAMLVYSGLVGLEQGQAQRDGRNFDIERPCRELFEILCADENVDISAAVSEVSAEAESYAELFEKLESKVQPFDVDFVITDLFSQKGKYVAGLLNKYLPTDGVLSDEDRQKMISHVANNTGVGPQTVICKIVEIKYGEEEAGQYAIALATGQAA